MPGNYCCVPLCNVRGGHKFPKEKKLIIVTEEVIRQCQYPCEQVLCVHDQR